MKLNANIPLYRLPVCSTCTGAIGRPQLGHAGAASDTLCEQSGQVMSAIGNSSAELATAGV